MRRRCANGRAHEDANVYSSVSMIAHERAGMTAAAPSPFAVYAD